MRVVFLIPNLPPAPIGGAERQALQVARRLREQGVDLELLTVSHRHAPPPDIDGLAVERVDLPNARRWLPCRSAAPSTPTATVFEYARGNPDNFRNTRRAPRSEAMLYPFFRRRLARYLHERSVSGRPVDLVYIPMLSWHTGIAAEVCRKLGVILVAKEANQDGFASMARFPGAATLQDAIRRHAHVVAMSANMRERLQAQGLADPQLHVIPNGVDLNRHAAGTERLPSTFLFVGNLYQQPNKGIDILLQAWRRANKPPGARLQFAGDGDVEGYRQFCEQQGIGDSVEFLGKRNDVPYLLRRCAGFILPSRYEGMSNALLEAMAAGAPCIVSNIDANLALVTSEENGLVVPVEDDHALAVAIERLIERPELAQQLGRAAAEFVHQHHDINRVASQYAELLQSLSTSRKYSDAR